MPGLLIWQIIFASMSNDLRPLGRALRELNFAAPLAENDPRYIQRPDGLGAKVMSRIEDSGAQMLLIAGPPGSGKSTELLHYSDLARRSFSVFHCPYDRDAGTSSHRSVFFQYLLWRLLYVATETSAQAVPLSQEIIRDSLSLLGIAQPKLPTSPASFFAELAANPALPKEREALLLDTTERILAEVHRHLPPLLIIDGLEKLPLRVPSSEILDLLRARIFDRCQAIVVVPARVHFGASSISRSAGLREGTSLLRILLGEDRSFVREVLHRRVGALLGEEEIEHLCKYSGGLVRDSIQLAADACQNALDQRSAQVQMAHVERACAQMRQMLVLALSDFTERAYKFLETVDEGGGLPGDPEMRDLTLSLNMIIEGEDGRFRVHPLLEDWLHG